MKTRRPSAATAHFVAKLLAVIPMPAAEVPQFMAKIDRTLLGLDANNAGPAFHNRKVEQVSPGSRRQITSSTLMSTASAISNSSKQEVSPRFSTPEVPPIEIIPPRRRGRPVGSGRKANPSIFVIEEPAPFAAAHQSKLLRKADVSVAEAAHHVPFQTHPSNDGPIHGVVKWFDGRSGKGALRLAGIGDISFDQQVLDDSHVKRLYRDQEIEAQVEHAGSKVRLLSISIPSRLTPNVAQAFAGITETTRVVKRQPRPVVVEIKRDTSKLRQSRVDAEQAFGMETLGLPVR